LGIGSANVSVNEESKHDYFGDGSSFNRAPIRSALPMKQACNNIASGRCFSSPPGMNPTDVELNECLICKEMYCEPCGRYVREIRRFYCGHCYDRLSLNIK
jgi:hypothetical protein